MKVLLLKRTSKSGFYYLAGINRPVNPAQVTKIAKSLNLMKGKGDITGCIRPIVVAKIKFITGKEEMYIIDGQHLFNALIRNNMDIPYTEIEVYSKKDLIEKIALLNASSKTWSTLDYITAWSAISDEYKKLNHYFNVYDFELTSLATILSGIGVISGGGISRKIKDGTFAITNEELAVKTLEYLTDLLRVIPRMNRVENRFVCNEYVNFLKLKGESYNHAIFIEKVTKNKAKFAFVTQETGCLVQMFEKLIK